MKSTVVDESLSTTATSVLFHREAFVKMEERSSTESALPKQAVTPCPKVTHNSAQNKKSSEELCGWGPQCPICVKSTLNLKTEDSEEEEWNGDWQKAKEEEKWKKEDQLKRNYYPQVRNTYHTTMSMVDDHATTEQRKKERERLEFLNDRYNLDYYSECYSESEY